MSAFATLVWKEWRDHRTPLLAFPLLVPPVIALGVGLLPAGFAKSPTLPTFVAEGCFTIAALTIVADLFPGEEQRGTIALLRRLPSGLSRVFLAKLVFALLVTTTLCGIGYLAATSASALLREGPWFPPVEHLGWLWARNRSLDSFGFAALLALPVAAWMFVVSTWLPRGTLALPAAMLLFSVFGLPLVLLHVAHRGLFARQVFLCLGVLFSAAPVVAGLSWVFGRRRGGGLRVSAGWCLLATLVLFTPMYASSARRALHWDRIDPTAPSFSFENGGRGGHYLSSDGRHALLTVLHREGIDGPVHAIAVNLADGSWRKLGDVNEAIHPLGYNHQRVPVPYVVLIPQDVEGRDTLKWTLLDTGTLEAQPSIEARAMPFDLTPEAAEFQRTSNALLMPDGRRIWLQGRELVTTTATGGVRSLPDSQLVRSPGFIRRAGLGMWLPERQRWNSVYDPFREKRFDLPESLSGIAVRPGLWIVTRSIDRQGRREQCLFEPETGEFTPLPPALSRMEVRDLVVDGRAIALLPTATDPRFSTLEIVDPETGSHQPIELPSWFGERVRWCSVATRTPASRPVLRVTRDLAGIESWNARLDVDERRLVIAGDPETKSGDAIGCLDEETLIEVRAPKLRREGRSWRVDVGGRIVRAYFGDARSEVLFPTSSTSPDSESDR